MSISRLVLIVLPIMLVFVIGIPVMIGVYVYRDANRRGMNAVLWTLVAILAPSLIGFLIYLLVRGSYSNLRCPQCDTLVSEDYIVCPKCGAKLQPTCAKCGSGVQPDWKVCPRCAEPLSLNFSDVARPYRPKDRGLSKILLVIIVIPLLLILLMIMAICGFSVFSFVGGERDIDSSSVAETSVEDFEDLEPSAEWHKVKSWMRTLDKSEHKAYIMRYVWEEDEKNTYYYLVYMPNGNGWSGFGYKDRGFQRTFVMEFYDNGENENMLYGVEAFSEDKLELEIYFDDKLLDYEVRDVDFNPACFWFDSDYEMSIEMDVDKE